MNMNMNENKVTERNVQAEHSNASASNAIVDDSAAAAASNELDALRAALQRTQQALAKAEHEVEQLRTQAADIHADTKTAIVTTTDSNKDADTITNGLDSHDSNINGTGNGIENGTGTGTGNGTQGKLTEQGREPVAQLTLESDSYGDDMNMNAKEKAAAVSERHLQLQYELADARAETAALNEQLVAAREALALQRKPQPQLLVLADSSTLNAFTTDKISASITAVETNLANTNA
jgi:predicted  nucleic acid-binding Zn-ribbon protein